MFGTYLVVTFTQRSTLLVYEFRKDFIELCQLGCVCVVVVQLNSRDEFVAKKKYNVRIKCMVIPVDD